MKSIKSIMSLEMGEHVEYRYWVINGTKHNATKCKQTNRFGPGGQARQTQGRERSAPHTPCLPFTAVRHFYDVKLQPRSSHEV